MAATKGMLYILVNPGDTASQDDISTWLESTCPHNVTGLLNATRYEAMDGNKPPYLAVYELQDPASFSISSLLQKAPPPKDIELVDLRVYNIFSNKTSPNYASAPSNRVFRTLALQPKPDSDLSVKDYNEWYEEDHVPLLSLSPGWLKSTRWTLKGDALLHQGVEQADRTLCPFLAIHEYENMDSFQTPEFKRAITSPWRDKVMPSIENVAAERRNFTPSKKIQ